MKMRVVGAARFRFAAARTTHSSSFAAPTPSVAMARGVPAAAANGSAWRFMPRKARLCYAERAWIMPSAPVLCGARLGYAERAWVMRSAHGVWRERLDYAENAWVMRRTPGLCRVHLYYAERAPLPGGRYTAMCTKYDADKPLLFVIYTN